MAEPTNSHYVITSRKMYQVRSKFSAGSMVGVPSDILDRALGHYDRISPVYANGIRAALAQITGARQAAE